MPKVIKDSYVGNRRTTVYLLDNGTYAAEIFRFMDTHDGKRWILTYSRDFHNL